MFMLTLFRPEQQLKHLRRTEGGASQSLHDL